MPGSEGAQVSFPFRGRLKCVAGGGAKEHPRRQASGNRYWKVEQETR